jgi:hypothetical protein
MLKPTDVLILIPRLLAAPNMLELDSLFLKRILKQGGRPGNRSDRKRFRRLLREHLRSIPLYPRLEPEPWEPIPQAVPERLLPARLPKARKEPSPSWVHVFRPLTSHRETDDAYPAVAKLSDRVRVIECPDGIQWILQRRRGARWNGVSFCRTRSALIREAAKVLGYVPLGLMALPEHYDDGPSAFAEAA